MTPQPVITPARRRYDTRKYQMITTVILLFAWIVIMSTVALMSTVSGCTREGDTTPAPAVAP
jgi:hypothetical protein